MSEEELTAMIDQAVTEAIVASGQSSTAASNVAADGTVSSEEVQTIEVYVAGAEEAIVLAEELIAIYYDLYGATAVQSVEDLQEIEQVLEEAAIAIELLNTTLNEITSNLDQGIALAEETIQELETAAAAVNTQIETVQSQVNTWQETKDAIHVDQLATVQAAGSSPQEILGTVFEFSAIGQQAIADNNLSPEEQAALAEAAATTAAVLNNANSPQLQALSAYVENASGHIGGGDLQQATASLNQLNIAAAVAAPPTEIAGDPRAAIQSAKDFAALSQQIAAIDHPSRGVSQKLGEFGRGPKGSPNIIPAVAEQDTAQSQHGLCAIPAPAHPGLFHAGLHNNLAGRLNGAAANGITGLPELLVAQAMTMGKQISNHQPGLIG
jgi:hypothetical protein